MKTKRQVLGNVAKPINYRLHFEPDIKSFKYRCIETIAIKVSKSTRSIRLNAANLKIYKATISSAGHTQKGAVKIDRKKEEITLSFRNPISGNANIDVEFSGANSDNLRGFYRSRYVKDGKEGYILTTQFEPNDARDAFVCFDEPAFKATFDISMLIDKKLSAVSNMPQTSQEDAGNGKKLVTFATTPRMSCYLLYFGVGEFEFVSDKSKGLPELRIVTVPGRSGHTSMAMEMTKKFLRYYERYFGIKYPLPKLDILAIPDFSSNAMENWGAMTFREIVILGDEKTTSLPIKQRIAEVIAHELAHQWFGDLVTMEWWDDLWLNESFATYMSYKAMHAIYPQWQMDMQYILNRAVNALAADQYSTTQEVGMKVNSPADMSIIFDPNIVYSKGGCLLAMFEDYVGEEAFRKGLHNYLEAHKYSNARGSDLWESISRASGKAKNRLRFDKVASYWIETAGYPIVDVEYSNGRLGMEQRRFLLIKKKESKLWPVPISYIKKTDKRKEVSRMLLDKRHSSTNERGLDYIKLNYMQKGFYRVRYSAPMLKKIGHLIKSGQLSPLDGWGVENDLFALARATRIKVTDYLDFVERYCMGSGYPLDSSVSGHLDALSIVLHDNKALSNRIKALILGYNNAILDRIGWEESKEERNVTTLLRVQSFRSLGIHGDRNAISKAKRLFDSYIKDGNEINKNLRSAVYVINARNGNLATYRKFLELYNKEKIPEGQIRILNALSSFDDPEIAKKVLDFSLTKHVRLQDAFSVPTIVASSPSGRRIIWKWTMKHWRQFMEMYDINTHRLNGYVSNLGLTDDKRTAMEISAFFSKAANMRGDIKLELPKLMERIGVNIRFKENNK